jgi:exodeoxyribonuclease VII small subunit
MARSPDKRPASASTAGADLRTDSRSEADDGAAGQGIDTILDRLEQVVADLEGGELPLEQALERFEQGILLARRGNTLLDRVEQRVEMLLADKAEVVPMPDVDDATGDADAGPGMGPDPRREPQRTR